MGNRFACCSKKKRVTFHPDTPIDRYEESIIRYQHIETTAQRIHETVDPDVQQRLEGKLALLIDAYVERCGEDVNVTVEEQHQARLTRVLQYKEINWSNSSPFA